MDAPTRRRIAPLILSQLAAGASPQRALRTVYEELYGVDATGEAYLRFLAVAASIARRVVLELAKGEFIDRTDYETRAVKEWYTWAGTFTFVSARMTDLYYFAGLSVRQVAKATTFPRYEVLRILREANTFVRIKFPPAPHKSPHIDSASVASNSTTH